MLRSLTLCLLLALAACDGATEAEQRGGPVESQSTAEAEASWAEQVEAVAAGKAEVIRVERTPIIDEDLAALEGMDDLRELHLGDARITGEGLQRIATLPRLRLLRISGAELDDADLAPLRTMSELRYLMLYDVPISDAGLRHLHELEQLESFYFTGTDITDTGIGELARARPHLHIHW